jgi:YfiH family protein
LIVRLSPPPPTSSLEERSVSRLHVLSSPALEERGVRTAFSGRTGGVSPPPFDSLNLGFRTGDVHDRVRRNRRLLTDALGIARFATGRQVHGARITRVGPGRAAAGSDSPDTAVPDSDGLAVTRPGVAVTVLVADCVPLVLASDLLLIVVHAGWRGLAAGIVDRAVGWFERPPVAAIGPSVGPCHYEVGEEVAAAASAAGARVERRRGSTRLDLPRTVAQTLWAHGVRRIDRWDGCTACEEERFFSHRRDGTTGRQAAVAWRSPS